MGADEGHDGQPGLGRPTPRGRILAATFFGSMSVSLLERGLYFYTKDQFDFSRSLNLWLGVVLGLTYIAGALLSHAAARRFGERRAVLAMIVLSIAPLAALTIRPTPALTWATFAITGFFSGGMWPIVESYVTAGLVSRQMLRTVGRFCIGWSAAVPVGLAITGPLIESGWPPSMFALAVIGYLVMFALLVRLPARPAHTPDDHPERPDPQRAARYLAMMTASRWAMLGGYALLFLLGPLLPFILESKLQLRTEVATPIASLIDWTRLGAFALLGIFTAWYGRAWPLLVSVLLIPVSFLMILFGPNLSWVLVGEMIFGLVNGLVYYAALYYAVAAKNAAVEAGGGHEALIGCGFAAGPLCGLIGLALSDVTGDPVTGMLLGVAPLVLLCVLGGTLPLVRLLRRPNAA